MLKISIQKISLNDLETLQAISRLTFYETFAEVNTKENMSSYLENELSLENLRLELSNPFSEFYFAYCEQEVIGYLKINFESAQTEQKTANSLEIERIYVRKEYLGKNIGQSLLEAAFQIARAKGFENVRSGAQKNWNDDLLPMGLKLFEKAFKDISKGIIIKTPQEDKYSTFEPSTDVKDIFKPDLLMLNP